MIEWLGIEHLVELSGTEAIAGFLTPLAIFVVFALAQIILPARRVPGYVIDENTGEPRSYLASTASSSSSSPSLSGPPRSPASLATGSTGRPSTPWPAAPVVTLIFTLLAVYTQPRTELNPIAAFWTGRVREISFLGDRFRFDVKMWFYVVGGTMLSLNALSGAAWHHGQFGDDANPGVYLYAAFYTFYILDYFVFERVQLYTYDLIHERLGFMLFWGGLIVYGWLFILPLWGMAAYPDPGFSTGWTYAWLIGTSALFLLGWSISRGANLQKYTFKRWPDRKFLGIIEPKYIEAGDRKILYSGFWGVARHFNYMGEGFLGLSIALVFGHFLVPWAWLYFIFVVSMFTNRQRDDDKQCAEKYGEEKWAEYKSKVKYRIFPGVY